MTILTILMLIVNITWVILLALSDSRGRSKEAQTIYELLFLTLLSDFILIAALYMRT